MSLKITFFKLTIRTWALTISLPGLEVGTELAEVNGADRALPYEDPTTTVVSTDEFWDYYHKKKATDGFTDEYAVSFIGSGEGIRM